MKQISRVAAVALVPCGKGTEASAQGTVACCGPPLVSLLIMSCKQALREALAAPPAQCFLL